MIFQFVSLSEPIPSALRQIKKKNLNTIKSKHAMEVTVRQTNNKTNISPSSKLPSPCKTNFPVSAASSLEHMLQQIDGSWL